jgi:hypothetical protein
MTFLDFKAFFIKLIEMFLAVDSAEEAFKCAFCRLLLMDILKIDGINLDFTVFL